MKKLVLLIVAAALTAVSASAQVVTSRTFVKSKSQTMWYVRAGMSINNLAGASDDSDLGAKVGMDADLGFHRSIGKSGAYWGMELGVGSRGASYDDENLSTWNVKYSPITFGYKYALTDDLKLDGHFGGFASYDFSKKWEVKGHDYSDDIDNDFDAGMQIGIGAWWKKLNIDFTYQRGFIKMFDDGDGLTSSNFEIRIGYAF